LEKKKVKYSSKKKFKGSKNSDFYGEGYFLSAQGSNYGRRDKTGNLLFVPYEEQYYLPRNREVAKHIVQKFHPQRVLVLGCARGYLVKALRALNIDAVGVDISAWAIENAPSDVQDFLYVGDICDLSLWKNKSFDVVVAFDVLEHIRIPDLYKAISETCRVGKNVLLDVPIADDDLSPDRSNGTDKSHVSVYTPDWWKKQFKKRGLLSTAEHVYSYPEGDKGASITFRPKKYRRKTVVSVSPDSKNFRILLLSNAPFVPSGYGVQTGGMAYRWLKHYDVRVLANYGLEGRALGLNDLYIYPKLYNDEFGALTAQLVNAYWKYDVLVTLFDIWMGAFTTPKLIHPRWIPIVPVDHKPIPEQTLQQATQAYKVVAMSKFGYDQFRQGGIEAEFIPHGIDTNVFKPSENKKEDKIWLEKHSKSMNAPSIVEITEDSFLIGVNAANKDPFRKSFPRMMLGFQIFLDNNPDAKKDARMYIHAWQSGARNLQRDARVLKVDKYIKTTFMYDLLCGLNDQNMTRMYNALDVFGNCAQAEGFGIPILEACACGVPPITTDWTSMTELTVGHGWLIPPLTNYLTALSSLWAIPNEYKIAEAYEDAYNNPKKVRKLGKKARKFSLGYNWDTQVIPKWIRLFEDVRAEIKSFGISEEKNKAYLEKAKEILA